MRTCFFGMRMTKNTRNIADWVHRMHEIWSEMNLRAVRKLHFGIWVNSRGMKRKTNAFRKRTTTRFRKPFQLSMVFGWNATLRRLLSRQFRSHKVNNCSVYLRGARRTHTFQPTQLRRARRNEPNNGQQYDLILLRVYGHNNENDSMNPCTRRFCIRVFVKRN